jgi:tetratricopeptide (TPR) repeat protein
MLRLFALRGAVMALCGLVLAGCATRPVTSRPRPVAQLDDPALNFDPSPLDPASTARAEAHAHYSTAKIHEMNEDEEGALEEYFLAASADPSNEALVLEVSRGLLQKKQTGKAIKVLKAAASAPGASGAIFARLGVAYSQAGMAEQARIANRMAIRKSPDALPGYQNLFLNYLQAKKTREALATLDEANRRPKPGPDFLVALSELYLNLGAQVPAQKDLAKSRALAALNRAAKLKPEAAGVRLQLADSLNLLGASNQAADLYLDLLRTLPDIPQVREQLRAKLTDIYIRAEDRQKAIEQLEAMVKDEPTNAQLHYFLGALFLDAHKPADAADHLSKAILLNANFEQAYYDLAIAQMDQQQTGDALATLDKARQRFPQSFILEFLSGAAFSRQKDYTQAMEHYTAAEILGRVNEPARLNENFYFQFGAACERKGDLEQAEKYFQKCLQLAPEMAEAMNYLGYMWTEHGINLERAKDLIEKALKTDPKNAAYLDSMGWVLFKLSQPQQALDYILRAASLEPEPDATIYDHLGDIYAALNQPDKARDAWNKSLSAESNDLVRKKLETEGSR